VDLIVDGAGQPELRIDGYVGRKQVTSARMSADPGRDRLMLTADDSSILGDGTDATRVTFRALDAYGHQRPHVTGDVHLALTGPAVLIGQNPFAFGAFGGVGGAFVRSRPGRPGRVRVTATHPTLGAATAQLTVTAPDPGRRYL
jgi:beta-galactosidase